MKTAPTYKVTSEGDCEGRTTRDIGYFKGTQDQIISYFLENNIKPTYTFRFSEQLPPKVTDCTKQRLIPYKNGNYGPEALNEKELQIIQKNKELKKLVDTLTEDEKKALVDLVKLS